jgi:hypothetical protein
MRITSRKDLEFIRGKFAIADELIIEAWRKELKHLFVYCLRYAAHSLRPDGKLRIEISMPGKAPSNTYSATTEQIAWWQIHRLIYRFQTEYFNVVSMARDSSEYILQRTSYSSSGNRKSVSIVVIAGGSVAELPHLECSIRAAVNSVDLASGDEVIVATAGYYSHELNSILLQYPVRVIDFPNDKDRYGRFLIGEKKNFAISKAINDIIVLIHARIIVSSEAIQALRGKMFDLCAPKVVYSNKSGRFSYLDAFVYSSVDLGRPAKRSNLRSIWFGKKYFSILENAYLIVDGGAWLINRAAVGTQVFDQNCAWGEAEDVEACRNLMERGRAVDFFPDVVFESQTTKIKWQKARTKTKRYQYLESAVKFLAPLRLTLWKYWR